MSTRAVALPVSPPARVLSLWGYRNTPTGERFHAGLDIEAPEGAQVHAILPGVVVLSDALEGYGHTVVVRHAPGLYSLSAHLAAQGAPRGTVLEAGTTVGFVGRSAGRHGEVFADSGPHLHLEFLPAWPPPGRGVGRLDPAIVLAQLGIVVPARGPLLLREGATDLPFAAGRPPIRPRGARSAGSGGVGWAFLLLALARRRQA